MGVEYLLVNHTKRRYVDPCTVNVGNKYDGVTMGAFPELIARLMIGEWRGDHVTLAGDGHDRDLTFEIHQCDPLEDYDFGPCKCEKSGKPHWRQDYRAIESVYRRRAEDAMSSAEDYRATADEFADVCECGHVGSDHCRIFPSKSPAPATEWAECQMSRCSCSNYVKRQI